MLKIILIITCIVTSGFSLFIEPKKGDNIKEIAFFNLQIENLKNKDKLVQIREINNIVNNKIKYISDLENYGKDDYIASARETINKSSGDCDDYLVLKMKMLSYLGIDSTVLYCQLKNVWHVKLVVENNGNKIVLDSANKTLRKYNISEGTIFYEGEKFKKIARL